MMKLAELPVTMEGLAPTVPAIVNGMPSRFILDTGAFYSLVTPRAAEKFGLRISSPRSSSSPGTPWATPTA